MELDIRDLLFQEVHDMAETFNGSRLGMAVQWPNTSFKRETLGRYLKVSLMNTRPTQLGTKKRGAGAKHNWILQLAIYVRDDEEEAPAIEVTKAIRERFEFGTEYRIGDTRVVITDAPEVATSIGLEAWYMVPVSVRVQAIF